jgi:hypothetical protein
VDTKAIITELKAHRDRLQVEQRRIDRAIEALEHKRKTTARMDAGPSRVAFKSKGHISRAGRERLSKLAKARWAKGGIWRKAHNSK